MKKLFVILPCLLLCLIMVAVPVSAASAPLATADLTDGYASFTGDSISQGLYSVELDLQDGVYHVAPVEFVAVGGDAVRYMVPGLRYNGEQVYMFVEFDEDYLLDFRLLTSYNIIPIDGDVGIYEYVQPTPAGIFDVFGVVGAWIPVVLGSLIGIFWTGSSLTFLGVLAVCALAFAVVFLIIAIIQRFLHFRG